MKEQQNRGLVVVHWRAFPRGAGMARIMLLQLLVVVDGRTSPSHKAGKVVVVAEQGMSVVDQLLVKHRGTVLIRHEGLSVVKAQDIRVVQLPGEARWMDQVAWLILTEGVVLREPRTNFLHRENHISRGFLIVVEFTAFFVS
uniref:Secreted protein n=1 Tax=Spongospora subterranea TaxID=70186 RepID=A0A0H5QYL8_9EUKA|eukprot:CRZ07035.1 hypothetical protein [Spongospora subterranea]